MRKKLFAFLGLACALTAGTASAANWGLEKGTPELKSAGPLAFGPDGILLVGDYRSAAVFAIETGDTKGDPSTVSLSVDQLNEKVAQALGTKPDQVSIQDLAVNPLSGHVYLSVNSGPADKSVASLVRVDGEGKVSTVSLKDVPFARVELADAPEDKEVGEGRRRGNPRNESITDLAYTQGRVLIAGVSNGASPSSIREIAFPFNESTHSATVEIYHAAHARVEDYATIRTFVPFTIDGKPTLLAGFTCTPLVKFPLDSVASQDKVRGTTVAELGNRNKPLDLIAYQKNGEDYLLMANSVRGVMKISTKDIARSEGLSQPVPNGGTAGQEFEQVADLKGVVQLDKLDANHAIILVQAENGAQSLKTIELP